MAPPPPPKNVFLPPGFRLPRYTIERRLSSGGFGAVYLARHDDGRSVALKEFLPSLLPCRSGNDGGRIRCQSAEDDRKFREGLRTFFQEADTVAKIRDDRVIAILDVFEANGTAYFAMPVEQGETLQRRVRRENAPIGDRHLQKIFVDAASGVEVLHQHGLLHLDLKPGNLWLRPDGSVVVLDLGAAREEEELRRLGPPARTPGFASPEQHKSHRTTVLTVQTDVYGLAASMFACIEKHPPPAAPERTEQDETLAQRRRGQRSQRLLMLVDKGLSLIPENRFATVTEFKERLLRLPRLSDDTGQVRWSLGTPPPLAPLPGPPPRG